MGGKTQRKHGSGTKKRSVSNRATLKHRRKDLDQIQDELTALQANAPKRPADLEFDEDLPGGGLHYCRECDRHFVSGAVKQLHTRTKQHRKRIKELKEKPYSQEEADAAAGRGKPDH